MKSLKSKAINGVKWTGVSTAVSSISQLLQVIILGRLLGENDFGLMATLMVVIGLSMAFSDMGISNAIIQRKNSTKEQLSSLYWLTVFSGIAVYVVLFALSPVISSFYKQPELLRLIILLSISFPITSFGQQFQILLQKEMHFQKISKIEIISKIVSFIGSVILAILGFGVYSLIWGYLISTILKTLMFVIEGFKFWKPNFYFKISECRGYIMFGVFQMGEKCVNYLAANMDYIIIGKFLGMQQLGIYYMAYNLVIFPLQRINPVLTNVAFPLFSKKQDDNPKLCYGYTQITSLLCYVTIPILIGLAAVAPVLVPVIMGPKWMDSIIFIQILSLLGIFKSLCNPTGSIILAKGRAEIGFIFNIITAVLNLVVFWIAVKWGAVSLAVSYSALSAFYFFVGTEIIVKLIALKRLEYFKVILKPLSISVFMGISVYALYLLSKNALTSNISLPLFILFGMGIYLLLILKFDKKTLNNFRVFYKESRGT